jgi:ribose-phosphate pyrophosphokinase
MELLLMIDAAKRASARHITAVIPYLLGQDRIERQAQSSDRSKINSQINKTAGATRVMTMDLHADQIKDSLKNQLITFCFDYLSTLCKSLGLDNLTLLLLIWEVLKSLRLF